MSKQQAILETLLGAAELTGNLTLIHRIRFDLQKMDDRERSSGYRRLALMASEPKLIRSQAA